MVNNLVTPLYYWCCSAEPLQTVTVRAIQLHILLLLDTYTFLLHMPRDLPSKKKRHQKGHIWRNSRPYIFGNFFPNFENGLKYIFVTHATRYSFKKETSSEALDDTVQFSFLTSQIVFALKSYFPTSKLHGLSIYFTTGTHTLI